MKVLLTGGTGFVGAHSARALLDAGHSLRLLARNPDAARRYYAQHGHVVDDIVAGDIRDVAVIESAMRGCDAVLHAAAIVSMEPGRAREMYENNLQGVKAVIGGACALGIRNIVYVSSLSVLFWPGLSRIDEETPLADCRSPYARSKRDSDEYVRQLQVQGHPIQISYASGVIGPDDPKLSEANEGLTKFVTDMIPRTSTGFQCVDVRDLALAHRYLLEHPLQEDFEQGRYIIGGHYYPWAELHREIEKATGLSIRSPKVPASLLQATGAMADALQKVMPFRTQISRESMAYVTQWSPADSSRYLRRSGLAFRPGVETFADSLRWMAKAGHLKPRYAQKLAAA